MRSVSPQVTCGIIAICSLAGIFARSSATETSEVVQWIRANAIPLETSAAGHGFADMQPLKKVVGDARIVALGEATHGTREFFQLKHRMLEFLATEMGFTIFSMEWNMSHAHRLNEFVLSGKGDPALLIKGRRPFDTQEILDMILWMREFNSSGRGPLQFTGFDMSYPTPAAEIVTDFVARADAAYSASLRQAIHLAENASPAASGSAFGVATATFPVKDAAGKKVRFSGYIKTEGVTAGYAALWWRVDGPSGMLAFDNMRNRSVSGTTDWKRCDIELSVAAEAKAIFFGALFPGNGSAWFDGLTIELDGTPYRNDTAFDLDFESSSPKGFFTGGDGYRVQLDSQVFHSGKQSLSMTRLAPVPKAVDPRLAASAWEGVVRHLETSREAYGKKGTASRDMEWAIQNARIVVQCMQMYANAATRDKSMADNVKWILDSNPGAKIVLWAHNYHVSTARSGTGGLVPMGARLRETFGTQLVVFGFGFNEGSFQAVDASKEGIIRRDFIVPPSPKGSFDATFAATGIPLFALDLRAVPKTGPVATWLHEPHETRIIGGAFSETSADTFLENMTLPESYDVMLFVDRTTAARRLN